MLSPENQVPFLHTFRTIHELAGLLNNFGFELTGFQTTNGQLQGDFTAVTGPDLQIFMIETDKGYRLVGEKDPEMTTVFSGSDFSGNLSFNGFTLDYGSLYGYNLNNNQLCFGSNGGGVLIITVFRKAYIESLLDQKQFAIAREVMEITNIASPGFEAFEDWIRTVARHMNDPATYNMMASHMANLAKSFFQLLETSSTSQLAPLMSGPEQKCVAAVPQMAAQAARGELTYQVPELQEKLELSEPTLSLNCRTLFDLTPGQLMGRIRLEAAVNLLRDYRERARLKVHSTVSAVCLYLNIDMKTLNRQLKSVMGERPGEFLVTETRSVITRTTGSVFTRMSSAHSRQRYVQRKLHHLAGKTEN